ncbi:MAG TPA: hypothetical protein VFF52_06235 [Isosphaeraceae bacterium]|nr:hypothetical protein [Isosphaeraceae bacterium]
MPAIRVLAIDGTFREIPDGLLAWTEPVTHRIVFRQVDFERPLQDVANAITYYFSKPSIRDALPSWSESR